LIAEKLCLDGFFEIMAIGMTPGFLDTRLRAGYCLPSGKHTCILTDFQTKVKKKRPKIDANFEVCGF